MDNDKETTNANQNIQIISVNKYAKAWQTPSVRTISSNESPRETPKASAAHSNLSALAFSQAPTVPATPVLPLAPPLDSKIPLPTKEVLSKNDKVTQPMKLPKDLRVYPLNNETDSKDSNRVLTQEIFNDAQASNSGMFYRGTKIALNPPFWLRISTVATSVAMLVLFCLNSLDRGCRIYYFNDPYCIG